jgi:LacI family transcriptional regulator
VKARKPLTKKATMTDVAKQALVSISSVSRVANNYPGVYPKLLSRVERAVEKLDYLPSVTKKKQSGTN